MPNIDSPIAKEQAEKRRRFRTQCLISLAVFTIAGIIFVDASSFISSDRKEHGIKLNPSISSTITSRELINQSLQYHYSPTDANYHLLRQKIVALKDKLSSLNSSNQESHDDKNSNNDGLNLTTADDYAAFGLALLMFEKYNVAYTTLIDGIVKKKCGECALYMGLFQTKLNAQKYKNPTHYHYYPANIINEYAFLNEAQPIIQQLNNGELTEIGETLKKLEKEKQLTSSLNHTAELPTKSLNSPLSIKPIPTSMSETIFNINANVQAAINSLQIRFWYKIAFLLGNTDGYAFFDTVNPAIYYKFQDKHQIEKQTKEDRSNYLKQALAAQNMPSICYHADMLSREITSSYELNQSIAMANKAKDLNCAYADIILGNIYRSQKQYQKMITAYTNAYHLDTNQLDADQFDTHTPKIQWVMYEFTGAPNNFMSNGGPNEAANLLADHYLNTANDIPKAIKWLEIAATNDTPNSTSPTRIKTYHTLAKIYASDEHNNEQLKRAEKYYKKAISELENSTNQSMQLYSLWLELGQLQGYHINKIEDAKASYTEAHHIYLLQQRAKFGIKRVNSGYLTPSLAQAELIAIDINHNALEKAEGMIWRTNMYLADADWFLTIANAYMNKHKKPEAIEIARVGLNNHVYSTDDIDAIIAIQNQLTDEDKLEFAKDGFLGLPDISTIVLSEPNSLGLIRHYIALSGDNAADVLIKSQAELDPSPSKEWYFEIAKAYAHEIETRKSMAILQAAISYHQATPAEVSAQIIALQKEGVLDVAPEDLSWYNDDSDYWYSVLFNKTYNGPKIKDLFPSSLYPSKL